jgi:hypothetical protein
MFSFLYTYGRDRRFFASTQRPDRYWGPPSFLYPGYWGALSSAVKRPGRKAHLIENGGAISPLHRASSWRSTSLIKYGDKFTFTYKHVHYLYSVEWGVWCTSVHSQ